MSESLEQMKERWKQATAKVTTLAELKDLYRRSERGENVPNQFIFDNGLGLISTRSGCDDGEFLRFYFYLVDKPKFKKAFPADKNPLEWATDIIGDWAGLADTDMLKCRHRAVPGENGPAGVVIDIMVAPREKN